MKKTRKGFTLIELVIVVAIIGILALMVIPNFKNVTENAKMKTFESNCRTIQGAIAQYQAANADKLPTSVGELETAGYIQKVSDNPEGSTYTIDATTGELTGKYKSRTYTTLKGFEGGR